MKKKQKKEEGVPEWVVTFGDMMSLLLCFFILLQMFSELKQDREYQRVVTAVKEAFGYSGGVGVLPIDDPPLRSMIELLEATAMRGFKETKSSQSDVDGVDGPKTRVTSVRDGMMFTLGGPAVFDEGSARVTPAAKEQLKKLVALMDGRNNKIIIRGHTATKRLTPESGWKDLDELAFARALAVKQALLDMGLNDINFRLESAGDREPLRPRVIDPSRAAENRRVDVILSEELIDDTNADPIFTDPDLARGGA